LSSLLTGPLGYETGANLQALGLPRLMSAAGDRVAIAGARGQSLPAPAVPAVSGREDLARLRYANNLLRVARMHGDAHHRRLRLDPAIEALPGLADVITAEDPAIAAAEGGAQGGVQHIWIMRRDRRHQTIRSKSYAKGTSRNKRVVWRMGVW
jgi:hypothetical protein